MDFKYAIIDEIDYTLEEQGNQFTALRKIRWGDADKEYLEIRRWRNTPDGGEQAAKGCTFMTEEGPANAINAFIDLGYGNTKEILTHLQSRHDFRKSLNSLLGKDDEFYDSETGTLEDDFYDPKSLIGG